MNVPVWSGIKGEPSPVLQGVKAMEAVQSLEFSREELLGVEGAERSEGDGGNRGGRPRPGDCGDSPGECGVL